MKFPRRSGILLHPTSLPGPYGIGDFGDAAYRWIDFLAAARQTYWQVLPLSPTGYNNSPYMGLSTFAGNHLLISPERLVKIGHLSPQELKKEPSFSKGFVNFNTVIPYKTDLLNRAFVNFKKYAPKKQYQSFVRFCTEQAYWLDDFGLFMALTEVNNFRPWYQWDRDLLERNTKALTRARKTLAEKIENHQYRQWQFFEQWLALKSYANARNIRIIGDIPFYVSYNSADVWTNPQLFHLDKNFKPTVVSGAPPDYFSKKGQLWGHPIYRWEIMKRQQYKWWIMRFRMAFSLADVMRIDHFRGFYNYWEIPAGKRTAVRGHWQFGPGASLFRAIKATLGDISIIAEDLGKFDQESRAGVDRLQTKFRHPCMRVLQFAFGGNQSNLYLLDNFKHNKCVVYTGTHDNDTSLGWYKASTNAQQKAVQRYLIADDPDIAWGLIRLAWASIANTAITTAQDLLSLGHQARLNTPNTVGERNWSWRLLPGQINKTITKRLLELTKIYKRVPTKK